MDRAAKNALLAIFGGVVLANHTAAVGENYEIRREHRQSLGERTEALKQEWREQRANAEIAAQFFALDRNPNKKKRSSRLVSSAQEQLAEKQLWATIDFFRRTGHDLSLGQADAQEISRFLGDELASWIAFLREQHQFGKWEGVRRRQLEQGLRAAEFIRDASAAHGITRLELLGEPTLAGHLSGEDEVAVRIRNRNPFDCPVPLLCIIALVSGTALVRWPSITSIPAESTVTVRVAVPLIDLEGEVVVRFARSNETYLKA